MTFSLSIGPIAALIAGILILILPRLLNYIIALYLIVVGVVGLFGTPVSASRTSADYTPPASSVQQTIPYSASTPIEI